MIEILLYRIENFMYGEECLIIGFDYVTGFNESLEVVLNGFIVDFIEFNFNLQTGPNRYD